MCTIRRFTEEDWHGYSGCTGFGDGSQPFIAEFKIDGKDATIVGGAETIELSIADNVGFEAWHIADVQGFKPSIIQHVVRFIMEKVMELCTTRDHLVQAGFEYIGEWPL